MSEKVVPAEDIGRGIQEELRKAARAALKRIDEFVAAGEYEKAWGALGTIEYILKTAEEWRRT